MSKGFLKKYLSDEDLHRISSAIAKAERNTKGEIRVSIRHRRHWRERSMPLHVLALGEFHRLGMHRTKERTGVLILLLFSERRFQIIADEGIHGRVEDGTWDALAEKISLHFREGKFCEGLIGAVSNVGAVLAKHFPGDAVSADELPNEVDVQ